MLDVEDAVVHEEDLSLPQQLASQGLAHGPFVELADVGENGLALGRRGVEQGQVANAGEAHLQGAGYGRGREVEDVDVGAQPLDGLLVGDAEALLLVHDQQAQVLEAHVAREQPVGADHHVDRAVGQTGGHPRRLCGRQEAGEDLDPHGEAGHAVGEGLEVLLGQERGGHQHGRLLAVLHGLEDGADGHLGLAEAHVAAHQAVHGHGLFHVALDLHDGLELVGRLREGEGLLHLPLPGGVGGEGVPGGGHPAAIEDDQVLGDLPHGRPHPGLGPLPVRPAQAVDAGRLASGIGLDGVDLVGGDVELVPPAVLEQEVVALGAGDGPGHHAAVAGHSVLMVHDEVPGLEVVEEALGEPGPGPGPAVGPPAPGEVALGQDGQLEGGKHEAPL